MTAKIKVLHSVKRTSKSGKPYTKFLVLVTIGKSEFVEVFYVFE